MKPRMLMLFVLFMLVPFSLIGGCRASLPKNSILNIEVMEPMKPKESREFVERELLTDLTFERELMNLLAQNSDLPYLMKKYGSEDVFMARGLIGNRIFILLHEELPKISDLEILEYYLSFARSYDVQFTEMIEARIDEVKKGK